MTTLNSDLTTSRLDIGKENVGVIEKISPHVP